MLKRILLGLAGVLFCAAAAAQKPVEGTDYLTLRPQQPTEAAGKIEVTAFFWYRCPYCYSLEPLIEEWRKKLPRDAEFRHAPAVFNDEWALDARIFFTLEATGDLARVHRPLFDAIHKQGGVKLRGDAFVQWVAGVLPKLGVDMAKYNAAARSFTVETRLRRAMQTTQAYKLDGVPAFAVNGRWLVSASMSGDRNTMIAVADYLIGEARKQLPKK